MSVRIDVVGRSAAHARRRRQPNIKSPGGVPLLYSAVFSSARAPGATSMRMSGFANAIKLDAPA
ncbi:MAG: hypothetical protein EHM55_01580 [Acidobacteria bacterium]|nr:MAG: hypothetical protein EHM55_01580 [Acidobacteriota bacterium]